MLKMLDKNYIAGIVDGEGSIEIHKQKGRQRVLYNYNVRVRISNTCRDLLLLVQTEYGGVISQRLPRLNRRKDYQLEISSHYALRLIRDILPFLVIKKEQATLALNLPRTPPGQPMSAQMQQRQEQLYKALKLLNKKGVRSEQLKMELEGKNQFRLF